MSTEHRTPRAAVSEEFSETCQVSLQVQSCIRRPDLLWRDVFETHSDEVGVTSLFI